MLSPHKLAAALTLLLAPGLAVAGQPGQPHLDSDRSAIASRSSRILSAGELCSSIQSALRSSGAPEAALPSAEQLRPAVPVTITVGDPGLQVLRMDADVVPGSVRVRLWTGNEPVIHPFDVRVLADPDLLRWLAQSEHSTHASRVFNASAKPAKEKQFAPPTPKPVTLVFSGRTATLLLRQPDMEVRTPVMPLNSGVSGQWIRVRNLSTGQTIAAQVVGPGSLVAQF
ncbi:MAG TPA: flagella basal body P-ring formation protein FlgA [Candidatus Acidoferrales bacterium]|jgi:hypothetical protein|nr:flagella basal body P-ring formation protein FlgA [Candidatus Acidoferrales bacterium]